jgi:NitT/TauT family transport system ATP-binding protein
MRRSTQFRTPRLGHRTDEAAPALELVDVSVSYPLRSGGSLRVLENASLSVQRGEFLSILGPSGCGKSTLLRVIDGLLAASGGAVVAGGQPVLGPGSDRAMVFQAHSLFPWQTVAQNVAFGSRMRGVPRKQARRAAQPYIELVGLKGFEDSFPRELSGGMQQRVNLARALSLDPELLLMDEPFAALDAQTRVVMQKELLRIWNTGKRKTVIFVTHNVEEAVFLSDRVVVLSGKPAHVSADIRVDLPRPRTLAMTTTPEFGKYVSQVWSLIEPYVFAGDAESISTPEDGREERA